MIEMTNRYLLNTTILATTRENITCRMYKITANEAEDELRVHDFVSAIGHQSTADLMSQILNHDIEVNRLNVDFSHGDKAIAFKTRFRGEEGKIYTLEELEEIDFDIYYMEFFDLRILLGEIASAYQHEASYLNFQSECIDDFSLI